MSKSIALPRPIGATALSIALALAATLALPASGLAAPLPGSGLPLVVTPSSLSLPKTTVGNQSQSVQVDLFNEGEEEAPIEKIAIEGEDSAAFSVNSSNCATTLFQNQHCQLGIVFQPGSVGEKHATAHVRFFGGLRAEESFALSGTAVPPQLSFHPASHDFGIQPTNGESQRFNFQLENDGEAGVRVGGPDFAGGSNGFWINNNDCSGRWMDPGETCSIEVGFGPNSPGVYSTQLRVNANGENFIAQLSGEGGRPVVKATPNPADFGAATVGSTGATRTIVLNNSGNVGTGFFIAVISGGDASSFHLIEENCTAARLEPASSCAARVRFTPVTSGQRKALTGEGAPAALTIAPAAYNFGAEATGTTSPVQTFAVRNSGAAPLDLDGASIVGADLGQFSLVGDSCAGATLASGEECMAAIRFSPDESGAKLATLRVRGDGASFGASLSGTATAPPAAASRVDFRWPSASRSLRRGTALSTGTATCQAAKSCQMTVSTQLRIVRRTQAGRPQTRVANLPSLHVSLDPTRSRSIDVRLPAAARRLLGEGRGTLLVAVQWSADNQTGHAKYSSAVR
jgi:hypothetical protein